MPESKRYQLIARTAATAAQNIRRIWSFREGVASGSEVGLILTEVYFTANPWVTAQYVTDRLAGAYSSDTIRRRLEDLVDAGSVEVIENGGRKLYRSAKGSAEETIAVLKEAYEALCD